MARAKTWDVGNVFCVPLRDGTWSVGQVVGREADMLNSITCAFFALRVPEPGLPTEGWKPRSADPIAVQFTTKDLLTRRRWKVVANLPVSIPPSLFPYESTRASAWVGAKLIGSANIESFLNAYFGLEPWDQMHDPHYFDGLLLGPEHKPSPERLVFEKSR